MHLRPLGHLSMEDACLARPGAPLTANRSLPTRRSRTRPTRPRDVPRLGECGVCDDRTLVKKDLPRSPNLAPDRQPARDPLALMKRVCKSVGTPPELAAVELTRLPEIFVGTGPALLQRRKDERATVSASRRTHLPEVGGGLLLEIGPSRAERRPMKDRLPGAKLFEDALQARIGREVRLERASLSSFLLVCHHLARA